MHACVCVCVLDHLTTVMRRHLQMITADVFITQPATVLSCAATESLNDNSSLRHAQETSHIDGWLLSVFRFNAEFQSERWLPMTLRSSSMDTTSLSFYQKNLKIMNSSSAICSFCSIHSVQTVHVVANVFSVVYTVNREIDKCG